MSNPPLPKPNANQAYCDVAALEGGHLQMIECMWVTSVTDDAKHPAPSLAFILTHLGSGKRVVFDLGIRADLENAIETVQKRAQLFDAKVPQDVIASLRKGGIEPNDVTHIIISHAHWDHVGDPSLFPKARFIQGGEARKHFETGYPNNPKSAIPIHVFPEDRTDFLDVNETWKSIGPFKHALDYFGDGSLYIIDAPGHLHGHINALVRTSSDGGWIFLAGDSSHDWKLLRGQGEIPEKHVEVDKELAADTIKRIRELMKDPRARVVMAHDDEFYEEFKESNAFWPGKIPSL